MKEENRQCELCFNAGLLAVLRTAASRLSCHLPEIPLEERSELHRLLYKFEEAVRSQINGLGEKRG